MRCSLFLLLSMITGVLYPAPVCIAQRTDTGFVSNSPISLAQFKDLFNQDTGMIRLILLLSPT